MCVNCFFIGNFYVCHLSFRSGGAIGATGQTAHFSNKGGVVASFNVADTRFCFVSSHLASGQGVNPNLMGSNVTDSEIAPRFSSVGCNCKTLLINYSFCCSFLFLSENTAKRNSDAAAIADGNNARERKSGNANMPWAFSWFRVLRRNRTYNSFF